jgi:hypothetical protein
VEVVCGEAGVVCISASYDPFVPIF